MNDARLRRHSFGFLEAVDRPTPQALSEYYEQAYYQNEASSSFRKSYSPEELEVIELRIAQKAAQARMLLSNDQPGSLLDVGCGEGFVLRFFERIGWQVQGIDYSRAGVQQVNPDYIDHVEQGDVFKLLEARIASEKQFDLVWLGNVLEHVLDPVGLLHSLRQLVAPGGLLVVTVPNDGTAYHEQLYASGVITDRFWIAMPDHLSYFNADSLRQIAEATRWDCLAILGDFPIDLFLAHEGSNYVADRSRGPAAHRARLTLERLIGQAGIEASNRFYAALADVGFGRNLTAFLRPKP
ncbi:class I SAM-dependent methyltransferase [Pseudomonas sp. PDM04]|jgi:2-polyprenyl-3-methyl-5-hydroxy-6-metoxy-1,4-benzoquinol methylase|uniref:class I SAM-dependent methyltransferase n=1 Tax=Pseudomonas sp. PDM04 TaxID=2769296 RepID=UPI00177F1949|nr:class I SAM-dependent methyltransferase [Pseudomonas sp. PDM04]MBD9438875.1 class I SAM-dependent methyltransferase [Pseudomonas sp. PDM04]